MSATEEFLIAVWDHSSHEGGDGVARFLLHLWVSTALERHRDLVALLADRYGLTGNKTAEWFEHAFLCRFPADNCPLPGDALFGHRLRIQWQDKDGEWRDWKRGEQ